MVFIPPTPTGLSPAVRPPGMHVLPSPAAAAGAAAAALLQRQLAADGAVIPETTPERGWTEHQTGDGRKFYHHQEAQISTWEKPEVLMSPEERSNQTPWCEYKIWDGRVFYHNTETKVSCWSMPPELRRLRGENPGIDDRPLPSTSAERRAAFSELMKSKKIDETWTFRDAMEATESEQVAQELDEATRKQCFAELLSQALRERQLEAREKERNAASALERLIEERFSRPEDLGTTYEEAAQLLKGEEAWELIKSDIRRDEVFQAVMERLEEKYRKSCADRRTERLVRLQRLMGSDPELRRARLRWKDALAILVKRDEIHEEYPPLDALRVWASLREIRHAYEHEADVKVNTEADQTNFREDRIRRDEFVMCLKELAARGMLTAETPWAEVDGQIQDEPRRTALMEGPGATCMDLFDEFQDDFRRRGAEVYADVPVPLVPDKDAGKDDDAEHPAKRARTRGWGPPEAKKTEAKQEIFADVPMAAADGSPAPAGEDDTNALDELIAGGASLKRGAAGEEKPEKLVRAKKEEEHDEDPLMDAVKAAAFQRVESSHQLKGAKEETTGTTPLASPVLPATAAAAAAPTVEGGNAVATALSKLAAVTGKPGSDIVTALAAEESKETVPPKIEAVPEPPATKVEESGTSLVGTSQASNPTVQEKITSADLLAKKVDDLRAMCRQRSLPVSGRKQELVDRLLAS